MCAPAGRDDFKALNCLLTHKEFLSPKAQKETNNDDEHNSSTTLVLTYKIYFIHSKILSKLMTMPPLLMLLMHILPRKQTPPMLDTHFANSSRMQMRRFHNLLHGLNDMLKTVTMTQTRIIKFATKFFRNVNLIPAPETFGRRPGSDPCPNTRVGPAM